MCAASMLPLRLTVVIASLLILAATYAIAQDTASPDSPAVQVAPADEVVRAVLSAHCASCHGPQREKPRGDFGYVLDLNRLAAEPALVRPGHPDQSELWQLIHDGDMPPASSPRLSGPEQYIIENWIRGLAAADTGKSAVDVAVDSDAGPGPVASVGRFHVLLVHFPIALLLAALLAELLSLRQPVVEQPAPAGLLVARFCTWTGALGAIAAAITGWAGYLTESFMRPEQLEWHKIGGTMVAVLAITAAVAVEWASRTGTSRARWCLRACLLILAVLIGITSHLGGVVVHGVNHVPTPF